MHFEHESSVGLTVYIYDGKDPVHLQSGYIEQPKKYDYERGEKRTRAGRWQMGHLHA